MALSPDYGELGGPPVVEAWRDIDLERNDTCLGSIRGRMKLIIVLAGRFNHSRSLEDISSRIGAVSSTKGLPYWSTTEDRWRPLISEAFALEDATSDTPRADFIAQEVLSGRTLYFAQEDTRSTSLNLYSLTARVATPDRMVIEIINLTSIRFWFVTLFEPRTLLSVFFIDRLGSGVWGYYGLSVVRDRSTEGHERSFVNRAAAYYRFITGVPADTEPPLAP